ncbi:MAG TPA: hypothetical protein VG347_04895 [Verrucomicrobiae bacterium]|nr:hypothetical protein [Verrucomicrobiae bacterium]
MKFKITSKVLLLPLLNCGAFLLWGADEIKPAPETGLLSHFERGVTMIEGRPAVRLVGECVTLAPGNVDAYCQPVANRGTNE